MRIRPVFWGILILSCLSILLFAATVHIHVPVEMQVHLQDAPVSVGLLTIKLHLSDEEGIPVEQAQIIPGARMTNMDMMTDATYVQATGKGNYSIQVQLSMIGPWEIHIIAKADGFDVQQQTLRVQVASPSGTMDVQQVTERVQPATPWQPLSWSIIR